MAYMGVHSHFLNKHDFLDQWIEEALEEMEDEIIAKIGNMESNVMVAITNEAKEFKATESKCFNT